MIFLYASFFVIVIVVPPPPPQQAQPQILICVTSLSGGEAAAARGHVTGAQTKSAWLLLACRVEKKGPTFFSKPRRPSQANKVCISVQPLKLGQFSTFVQEQHRTFCVEHFLTLSPTALGSIQGFQLTAQSIKALKICKKLLLSDFILRLFYNIRNLHIWPILTAISFQSQNLCHNKSTQQMAPQRSDLASREGGDDSQGLVTNRVSK